MVSYVNYDYGKSTVSCGKNHGQRIEIGDH